MSITAKELAQRLNLSTASVSVALHNKPGVSTATRKRILEAARDLGYDFSSVTREGKVFGMIYYVRYIHFRSPQEAPFFGDLLSGIEEEAAERGCRCRSMVVYGDEDFDEQLEALRYSGCAGILLLGTDITRDKLKRFLSLGVPVVLMDTWFHSPSVDCVKVNNIQGAYLATEYLIKKKKCQPGYLRSSLKLFNYEERFIGYCQALETYRMSVSNSIIHETLPNMHGSEADMRDILRNGEPVAQCYVADTDAQAIGAMTAFQKNGRRVPEDVAFVGFDNSRYSEKSCPGLTTIEASPLHMAATALDRLTDILKNGSRPPVRIEIGTRLIERGSA